MSARTNSGRDAYGETSHGPPSRQGRGRGWRRGSATVVDSKVRASKPNAPRPSARDVSTSQRRMDLMASVSRSSGLEKDGDDLKNSGIQEEYRTFIHEKTNDVMEMFTRRASESEDERRQRIDKQENLLILFRKLREGVSSSSREDAFALEVYQSSFYYSIIFESPKQTTSIISHLFPPRSSSDLQSSDFTWPSPSMYSVLGSLLHYLVAFYPSQSMYHQHLASIPERSLPRKSEVSSWLLSITKSLRRRDYARFTILSQKATITELLEASRNQTKFKGTPPTNLSSSYRDDLATNAVLFLVDALRKKTSSTSWAVLRSAYRELWCDQAFAGTKTWLRRTLTLESVIPDNTKLSIETWLEEKESLGDVRRKDGTEARWIVCKAR